MLMAVGAGVSLPFPPHRRIASPAGFLTTGEALQPGNAGHRERKKMIHHFGILLPPEGKRINGQKPLFGGTERDYAVLSLDWTELAADRAAEERPRFVRLVMPPYL